MDVRPSHRDASEGDDMDVRRIVVGVDGSASADAAVSWAAAEADRRGLGIELLHARTKPGHEQDDEILDAARRRVNDVAPSVPVLLRDDAGDAASSLLVASATAEFVVVGTHGKNVLARMLVGSVSHRLVARSACPVVVVHGGDVDPALPVAVGVDGSPGSDAAVTLAAEEAVLRGVPLVVVHGWLLPAVGGFEAMPVTQDVVDAEREAGEEILAAAVHAARALAPALEVRTLLVTGTPVVALSTAAEDAQLVVVGAHGRQGLAEAPFGSVTSAAIDAVSIPVLVSRVTFAEPAG